MHRSDQVALSPADYHKFLLTVCHRGIKLISTLFRYNFFNGRWKLVLSRIFIRRRELTQFIRKPGLKTVQLRSIDHTTRGAENPERLRSADHTTRHFGGLDWDLNTHRSTQTPHRSDWDINTINSKNFKGLVRSDWDIDPGLHNSCSAVDASQHTPPRTTTSLLPRSKEKLLPTFCKCNQALSGFWWVEWQLD
jgi:hypothetical protein